MVKIIRYGLFEAEVDTTDFDNVKIRVTMAEPLETSDYNAQFERIRWEKELETDARILRMECEDYIMRAYEEARLRDAV